MKNTNNKKYTSMDIVAIITTTCLHIMGAVGLAFLFVLLVVSIFNPKINLSSYDVKCNNTETPNIEKEEVGVIKNIETKTIEQKPLEFKLTIKDPIKVTETPLKQTLTTLMSNDTITVLDNPFTLINVGNDVYEDLENKTLKDLNIYRLSLGLNECKRSINMHLSAHEKADWIYDNKSYSHDIIFDNTLYAHGIFTRQWGVNAQYSRENLDISSQSDDMVEDWKASIKHNASMTTKDLEYCDLAIIKLPDWDGGRGAYLGVLHMTSGTKNMAKYIDPLSCDNIMQCKQDNLESYMLTSEIWKQSFNSTTLEYNKFINTPINFTSGYYDR